jgi:hypothetical protein
MKGIEFAEVRDAITRAFNADEFDMFLYERLEFDRPKRVAEGPFRSVVTRVLQLAQEEGWDPILIAEVAAARPLKRDVQEVYTKYAQTLVDEARAQKVQESQLEALSRFGLGPSVTLQRAGSAQLPSATLGSDQGFERRVRQDLPFLDVGLWRERMFQHEGRVCRVEIGGVPLGTGFLVGPTAVLTNYHVLRTVIENPAKAETVKLRFDYRVLPTGAKSEGTLVPIATADWLIDFSPYTDAEAKKRPDESQPTKDQLDYALVRLSRSFGEEPLNPGGNSAPRGWVYVPKTAPALEPGMPILILQHPNTTPLKLAFDTAGVLNIFPNGTRVRYATNTEGGSSGSPCFDVDWSLVALHHYGDPLHDKAQYNQGIPIAMIRDRLQRVGKDAALGVALT